MATLRVGQKAPDFDVTASDGTKLRLEDFVGKKNVVLYFYPGDFTPVCTRETCGFRDMHEALQSQDTEIIGVSVDSDASHRRFADQYKVPFPLVSDVQRSLSQAYGATSFLGDLFKKAGRATFVIDKKGEIAGIFRGELSSAKHTDGVRELVRKLERSA